MLLTKKVKSFNNEYLVKVITEENCIFICNLDEEVIYKYEYAFDTSSSYIQTIERVISIYEKSNIFNIKEFQNWDGDLTK